MRAVRIQSSLLSLLPVSLSVLSSFLKHQYTCSDRVLSSPDGIRKKPHIERHVRELCGAVLTASKEGR